METLSSRRWWSDKSLSTPDHQQARASSEGSKCLEVWADREGVYAELQNRESGIPVQDQLT